MTTTDSDLLYKYRNGNCTVTLYADGTKVRECDGTPAPERPESVDLKVTAFCNVGCPYCHESATPMGHHANLETVKAVLADARAGMEVAIGGGDPMAWPDLKSALEWMRSRGLVANLTVHGPVPRGRTETLAAWQRRGLVHGIGASWVPGMQVPELEHVVIHAIAGIHGVGELAGWLDDYWGQRVLILGYKRWGRGVACSLDLEERLADWRHGLHKIASNAESVSFDNLALEQLQVRSFVSARFWKQGYMGDDGQFTMYLDAVTDSFAANSTSERQARNGRSLSEMFAAVRASSWGDSHATSHSSA